MNNNNQKLETRLDNQPLIFSKKVNLKHKIIPLDIITNTIGPIRFFPPATKEWFNSIYAYNKNSIKNLSVADKTIRKLINSYFSLFFNKNIIRSKKILRRLRRLSLKKIFISKAELKHTNSNVNITLYVYNEEKRDLDRKLNKLENLHFVSGLLSRALPASSKKNNKNLSLISLLRDIRNYQNKAPLIDYLERLQLSVYFRLALYKSRENRRGRSNNIKNLWNTLNEITEMIILSKTNNIAKERLDQIYTGLIRKILLYKEIKEIASCKLWLDLNKSKFEDNYLNRLKSLIGKIYGKKVEFNIVNLTTLYFNSDIFTQAVSMRIKNRKNSLLRVLKAALHLVKLPAVNKIRDKYGIADKVSLDHLKNVQINSVINKYNTNKDTLDQLLLDILPYSTVAKSCVNEADQINSDLSNPLDLVISSLKYKTTAGVRLETRGRLTKRFTASRSVFKVKWKGSIKNLDSSYKKLSSVMLRGHAKSNVDYTNINTKTRNGSFGLKGWISSK
uniref:Small ribosomal subunit protein uS3m n=1 Tax=Antarctomyces pellizariae TaxID=1955577 RepID=A0A6H1U7Q6_9PEZI|nr:ribosomal protein S3 [Antarctomyces pellizariae]YP_010943469.1 ribosomal protein S3 [Antarctomyces psychrotrophicus]QIZ74881.1 ribosomal protein S3 [Antarctomyces pellizariae]WLS55498.1 ribosomal protein S3 [Antarctomyces psychrotrophicus]